jgi:hypothetical protein
MYKFLLVAVLSTTIAAPALAAPGNYIGPGVTFGLGPSGDASFGLESKFDLSSSWSFRPGIAFGNGGTQYGALVSYNLDIFSNPAFTPFVGAGVAHYTNNNNSTTTPLLAVGLDYELSPQWVLLTKVNIPLSNNLSTGINISAGYRF